MSIPSETIEQVRLKTDIVDLVREYVPSLKRSGRNWKAPCPFHNEKTPSFMVSSEKGIFHCFGCNAGGDAFKFIMMVDSISWPQSVKKLAERVGIVIEETEEVQRTKSQKQRIYGILEKAADFYHRCLLESKEAKFAREYLKKRGVNEETARKFQIGYAPNGLLIPASSKKGLTLEDLSLSGLITKTAKGNMFEYMQGRLVFPITDSQGRVIAFGGRILGEGQPKYINTPETQVYSKSNNLYGIFQAAQNIRRSNESVIMEGYMDVVMSHQYGISTACASCGTSFTKQQALLLKRYCENVVVIFDSDKAGIAATRRAIDVLVEEELSVYAFVLPDNTDPDEYLLSRGKDSFLEDIKKNKKPFVEFLSDQGISEFGMDSPEAKSKVISEVLSVVEKIKNPIAKSEWIKRISGRFGVSEDAIRAQAVRMNKKTSLPDTKRDNPAAKVKMRSAYEETLQVLLFCPELVDQVDINLFTDDQKVAAVINAVSKKLSASEILAGLDEGSKEWFTELAMEEKEYDNPESVLQNLQKDIRNTRLESRRRELGSDVEKMNNGLLPMDKKKIDLFMELTIQLKGSGR